MCKLQTVVSLSYNGGLKVKLYTIKSRISARWNRSHLLAAHCLHQLPQHTQECLVEGSILGNLVPSQGRFILFCLSCLVEEQLDVLITLGTVPPLLRLHLCKHGWKVHFAVAPFPLA